MIIVNLPVSFKELIILKVAMEKLSVSNEERRAIISKINNALSRFYKRERVSMKKWKKEQGLA